MYWVTPECVFVCDEDDDKGNKWSGGRQRDRISFVCVCVCVFQLSAPRPLAGTGGPTGTGGTASGCAGGGPGYMPLGAPGWRGGIMGGMPPGGGPAEGGPAIIRPGIG